MKSKIKKVLEHFKKVDPILYETAKKVGFDFKDITPKSTNYFYSLCREIIGQQLSKKAASTIFARFKRLFPREEITAKNVLKVSDDRIRKAGASWAKVKFVKDLAQKTINKKLELEKISELDNLKVVEKLTQVKGIGPWTAEMFLMFTLGREDVFSHGDLGLRKTIKKIYSLKDNAGQKEIEVIANTWSPYRTYACLILWKHLDS